LTKAVIITALHLSDSVPKYVKVQTLGNDSNKQIKGVFM